MDDEILRLFTSKKIKEKFLLIHHNYESDLYEECKAIDECHQPSDPRDFGDADEEFREVKDILTAELPKPLRITGDEIQSSFLELLDGVTDFKKTYEQFLEKIEQLISPQKESSPIHFCKTFALVDNSPGFHIEEVWKQNGIKLSITKDEDGKFSAIVSGKMSAIALDILTAEIVPVLLCAVRSIIWLHVPEKENNLKICAHGICKNSISYFTTTNTTITSDIFQERVDIIREYLKAYFYDNLQKQDSLDKRIYNAVHLLIISDEQTNHAVGLALSVAGIEALLCESDTNIAGQLACNVATLLEPETDNRDDAEQYVKKIYHARSRLLHGDKIESERAKRIEARHLAAAVLDAVILKYTFNFRLPNDDKPVPYKPKDLRYDLKKRKYKGGSPDGVVDYRNIRKYWRK